MSYLQKSSNIENRKRNEKKRIVYVAIILFIILLILVTPPLKQALFIIAKPIWQVENLIVNSSLAEYFKSKGTLIDERLTIEKKLFLAGNLLALNESLQSENEILKDLLGRKEIMTSTVLAVVLVKPPQAPYDFLIIDIGEDYGVSSGLRVVANTNVYIGEISEVYAHTSKVILYSSPGQTLPVVLGLNSVSVEAVGVGGNNFNIFLPREVEVQENDIIIIPSINPNVFGIVEEINFKDTDSFQTVLFKSPVNISELRFVEVILDN